MNLGSVYEVRHSINGFLNLRNMVTSIQYAHKALEIHFVQKSLLKLNIIGGLDQTNRD